MLVSWECSYFLCNGIERIIRMLQLPRRNHIMATNRSAFAKRGRQYTTKAVSVRCARADQTSVTVTLHYLHDGNATLRFSLRKQEFFIPVILVLRALKETTDREVYERVLRGNRNDTHLADRVELVRGCRRRPSYRRVCVAVCWASCADGAAVPPR